MTSSLASSHKTPISQRVYKGKSVHSNPLHQQIQKALDAQRKSRLESFSFLRSSFISSNNNNESEFTESLSQSDSDNDDIEEEEDFSTETISFTKKKSFQNDKILNSNRASKSNFLRKWTNFLQVPSFVQNLGDIPPISDDYLFIPIPDGERCLILVEKGHTLLISSKGKILKKIPSSFPGGSNHKSNRYFSKVLTLLDAIYYPQTNTCYLFDLIMWNSVPFYHVEFRDRRTMLSFKLSDFPALKTRSKLNPIRYFLLPSYSYTISEIQNLLRYYAVLSPKDNSQTPRKLTPTQKYPLTTHIHAILLGHKESRHLINGEVNHLLRLITNNNFPDLLPDIN